MNNKKNNKGSKMTIDKLAIMMKAGFGGVNKKIDSATDLIDKLAISTKNGFDRLEAKMATKEDLKNLEAKIDTKVDTKVEELKGQIQGIDKRIDDFVETRVKYEDFNKLKIRVEKLEKAK